ncbi:TetR/AcrR family transcriptional regulator [Cognataquiflexum aquatile]|uniref:TetR/AcrR family transcriptional regulator n=1 Tax=Cognataquiflexum aquatile TaxID=2249427 RepID=UPI000DE974D2|nr:TetR/AcrR family transcriptional regulator [Cognataquiflexum aquatile]
MGNYQKGVEMRQTIIREARKVYNSYGLNLTLNQLAAILNLSKGRITNYFPTKEDLFVAISKDYDEQFANLFLNFDETESPSFERLYKICSVVMDLQYEYRSAIIFVSTTNSGQKEIHERVTESYKSNFEQVRWSVLPLIDAGLITSEILQPEKFEVFSFQYVSLFTTWVISLEIYHTTKPYAEMKPVYLKGILGCFFPYLTEKGLKEFQEIA